MNLQHPADRCVPIMRGHGVQTVEAGGPQQGGNLQRGRRLPIRGRRGLLDFTQRVHQTPGVDPDIRRRVSQLRRPIRLESRHPSQGGRIPAGQPRHHFVHHPRRSAEDEQGFKLAHDQFHRFGRRRFGVRILFRPPFRQERLQHRREVLPGDLQHHKLDVADFFGAHGFPRFDPLLAHRSQIGPELIALIPGIEQQQKSGGSIGYSVPAILGQREHQLPLEQRRVVAETNAQVALQWFYEFLLTTRHELIAKRFHDRRPPKLTQRRLFNQSPHLDAIRHASNHKRIIGQQLLCGRHRRGEQKRGSNAPEQTGKPNDPAPGAKPASGRKQGTHHDGFSYHSQRQRRPVLRIHGADEAGAGRSPLRMILASCARSTARTV